MLVFLKLLHFEAVKEFRPQFLSCKYDSWSAELENRFPCRVHNHPISREDNLLEVPSLISQQSHP